MTGIFDYDSSWLNPGLKLIIVVLYLVMAYGYIRARRMYTGDLYRVFSLLFWMGTVGALAALFRYFDHGTMFGFTKQYSLKWFQSLGYVVQALLFVLAVRLISKGIVPEIREQRPDKTSSKR
jgi:hypothetical protein